MKFMQYLIARLNHNIDHSLSKSNSADNNVDIYNQNYIWFSLSFFLLFFTSKSLGLTIGYALDDYVTSVIIFDNSEGHMQNFLFSEGRFTFAFLHSLITFSGLKQPELAGLGFFLCAGGLLYISWVTLARWIQKDMLLAIAVGSFLGSHPFFAEYVSFRQSLFPTGVCFVLIACATTLIAQDAPLKISHLFTATGLAAMASGINQIAMVFFCVAVLGISLQKNHSFSPLRAVFSAFKSTVLIGAVACVFYLVVFSATRHIFTVDPSVRISMLNHSEIGHRLSDVAMLLINIFGGNHPLVGPIAAICTAFAIFILGVRAPTRQAQWLHVLTGIFVVAAGIILALLPISLSGVWWPMPRTLIALPLVVALGIANLSFGASRVQIRAASAALFITVVIFSGKSNGLLMDQQRLNRWDMGLAREVVMKITEKRKIEAITPIMIHGAKWAYEIDQSMPIGDANVSAFSINLVVGALFEEATGRRLNVKLGVEGDTVCNNSSLFPNSGSIHDVDGIVHVCF